MTDDVRAAVDKTAAAVRQVEIDQNLTYWTAATTGTPEALAASAQSNENWMRLWADPDGYQTYKAWDESGAAGDDAYLERIIHLLHYRYARGQADPVTIREMTQLEKTLDDVYINFRAEADGQRMSANDVDQLLRTENDSAKLQAIWEASKEIGPQVADSIRRLAQLRNEGAQRMGYRDFHRMSLTLNELDPDWLFGLLDDLARKTDEPFRQAKADLDAELSARFGVPAADLMPWHYEDLFFQRAPITADYDFDALFEGKNLEDLALKTYDGLGMDVRDILNRSDLYEREGKNQHAFCMDVDREGDVRILCNLQPSLRWTTVILHELGHGVYNKYVSKELPWLLRTFPHLISTEAMAILMESVTLEPEWHEQVLGLAAAEVEKAGRAGLARSRLEDLIRARWAMVVVNFERLMYEDPSRDLDATWWNLVHQYQMLNIPAGRERKPDWATKYHIALAPAYYQNYLLGSMMALQWSGWLRENVGGIVGRKAAGEFFRERIFKPGKTRHWNDALEVATGEKLNPDYFARKFAG